VASDPLAEVAAWDNDAHGNCAVATEVVPLGAYFDQFLTGRPQSVPRHKSPSHPEVKFVR
jgi:hypothetical protein